MSLNKIINIVFSPWSLALPIAFVLFIFIPIEFNKYRLDLVEKFDVERFKHLADLYYHDFDKDGISEQCYVCSNELGNAAVKITRDDQALVDQWNFAGSLIKIPKGVLFGDYDNNGQEEVYFFSQINDSIFIHAVEPFGCGVLLKNTYICTIRQVSGKFDYVINNIQLFDLNKNGYKEVIICVKAGFSLQPRSIFKLEVNSGLITKTPETGSIFIDLHVEDINEDGEYELFGDLQTTGNLSTLYPCHDSSVWLLIFDNELQFFFDPVEFKGYGAYFGLETTKTDSGNFIIGCYDYKGQENIEPQLCLFDLNGNMLRKKKLAKPNKDFYYRINKIPWDNFEHIYLFTKIGEVYKISSDLSK
jgi:hypothetical protein